ncbi:MAG: hemolysin III family protein [Gemmataceae bacterium]
MDFHDPVASGSHLFTAAWAFFAMLVLVRLSGNQPLVVRVSLIVFGMSMVLLYLASGFYHGLRYDTPEQKEFWLRMDRSAIFLLILGSQLPIFAAYLTGWRRTLSMSIATTIALIGIIYQWIGVVSQPVAISIYVGMGATGMLTIPWWARLAGWNGMIWFSIATGLYVLGAAIEAMQWPNPVPDYIGHHELLHLCDTIGSLVHFGFVVKFVSVKSAFPACDSYDSLIEAIPNETEICFPAATTSATT